MIDKILLIGSDLMMSEIENHCLEKGLNVVLFKAGVSVLQDDLIEYANAAGVSISDVVNKVIDNVVKFENPENIFPVSDLEIAENIHHHDFREFKPNFASHINKGGKKNKSAYHNQHKFRRR